MKKLMAAICLSLVLSVTVVTENTNEDKAISNTDVSAYKPGGDGGGGGD